MNILPLTALVTVAAVSAAAALAAGCTGQTASADAGADDGEARFVGRVYDESGNLREPAALPKVTLSDAQWKSRLDRRQYGVLRGHGTERAFSGKLLRMKAEGVYRCAGCDLPLFESSTKFKSGTGWPSFYAAIADGNVGERTDRSLGMARTEIHCGRCEGHLGHVFTDGPQPTGQRYCVNSLSLAFTPIDRITTLAEPLPPETAEVVFAGGCFWCVEAVFEELDGVEAAISGYAGGTAKNANYPAVSAGGTKHAEVVKIVYVPEKISYEDLLRVHFATHDPTTLNRQGNDVGPQYRSTIFYADDQEKALAEAFIADLNDQKAYGKRSVVTTLEPLTAFYPAERYHQNYVCENPSEPYVRKIALPKVKKVRKQFRDKLKDKKNR